MGKLHVFFFPFMAHGHMIPTLDMAKQFVSHGVKATIVTTPLNAPIFNFCPQISVRVIKFPAKEAGSPEGCECIDQIGEDLIPNFFRATLKLQEQLEHVLDEARPDCLVADLYFPWATTVAAKFNIPRLVFHGMGCFPLCVSAHLRNYKPQRNVSSDSEPFIVPKLPHEVKLTRKQLPDDYKEEVKQSEVTKFTDIVTETELTSFGVLVNSFYELEPAYADHYRTVLGRKTWHIGPVSLCNREVEDKAQRGKETSIDKNECLKWLDSKKPNSVIFVCFGSLARFAASQLHETALGLEASGQDFIWAVRKGKNEDDDDEKWLPEGFEERMNGKGLIIRGWAPQVLILDHEAVGGFVTHCGWNSTLEAVSAGVPMVTWPVFAEQFFNEKLVTEILRIGVGVGSQEWKKEGGDGVKREAIEKAVKEIMVGEEAEERRRRGRTLKEMAWKAVEEGGSSYKDLEALIKELSAHRS